MITNSPFLGFYNLSEHFILKSDASKDGVGSYLMQNGRPIAFASKSLAITEQGYAQIENEVLGILLAAKDSTNTLMVGRSSTH